MNVKIYISILIIGGFLLIYWSTQQVEYVKPPNKAYNFEFDMITDSDSPHSFSDFSFNYTFSEGRGSLSFLITFVDRINYITIDFPRFINEGATFVEFEDCSDYPCMKTLLDIKTEFKKNPVNGPYYTTLILSKFPEDMYHKKIKIIFKMKMKPGGMFQFYSSTSNPIYSSSPYGINYVLGHSYICPYKCLEIMRGFEKYPITTEQDMKLKLTREVDSNIFILNGVLDTNVIFLKNFSLGLGISIFSVGLIKLGDSFISRRKRRDEYFKHDC